jgi:hypothetical protein
MNEKTQIALVLYDYDYTHSAEFRQRTAPLRGMWKPLPSKYTLGNELILPVLYPDKDAEYNASMWLTFLGFTAESFEHMGDWSSEIPKFDAEKLGVFIHEADLLKNRPHRVQLSEGVVMEFELI